MANETTVQVKVKQDARGKWNIYAGGQMVEGGFFSKDLAEQVAETYRHPHHLPATGV